MKIGNKAAPKRASKTITIQKLDGNLTLTVQALPLGFEDRILDWLPLPGPPEEYAEKNGKPFKDVNGQYVVRYKRDDPKYVARIRKLTALHGVAIVYEGLKADREVSWETQEPAGDEGREQFYLSIMEELRALNITAGDFTTILTAVNDLSLNKARDLKEKREGFSPEVS